LYEKLGFATIAEAATNSTNLFNSRTRAVYLALARGLINVDALRREQQNFEVWATHAAGARKRRRRTQLSKALALAPTVETRSR
jgi:hypothetical protein